MPINKVNKVLLKQIIILILIFFLLSCGGSSGLNTTKGNNKLNSIKFVQERLNGLWRGSLEVYEKNTAKLQCKWDITLNLSSTIIPDTALGSLSGSKYLGSMSYELIYSTKANKRECKSGGIDLEWDALCYPDEVLNQSPYACGIFLSNYDHDFDHTSPVNEIDTDLKLSQNKIRLYVSRNKRDAPLLKLLRVK